jgi:DNA-binding transcriptional MerR regulator
LKKRDNEVRWKVGRVARRAGLTVRALHHYEQIGLLVPAGRTESNHRLYTQSDIERLQKILTLRQLGLTLEQIAEALRDGSGLLDLLERQLEDVQQRRDELEALQDHLSGLITTLRAGKRASTDNLFSLMERMNMIEKHYTKEQLDALAARREAMGEEAIHAVESEWPTLIAAMTAAMTAGTDPADPEVQRMAARWRELVAAFTGGYPATTSSLQRMYEEEPAQRQRSGLDPALMAYVQRAWSLAPQP